MKQSVGDEAERRNDAGKLVVTTKNRRRVFFRVKRTLRLQGAQQAFICL